MKQNHVEITMLVDQPEHDVFKAINNVRGWWSENIQGETDSAQTEFLYHYRDVHSCKIKVKELIPDQRIVWEVLENHFSFTKDPGEWVGDEIVFEISSAGNQTRLTFSQIGLTPADECYEVCEDAWTGFITNSLRKLIRTGNGEPTQKDTQWAFNEALIEKWKLNERSVKPNFSFSFVASQPADILFSQLLDINQWWSGLYNETIQGESHQLNDAFTFRAGGGAHYSEQKLIELIPNKKVVWLVTDSNLSFLHNAKEWVNTRISFELFPEGDKSRVTFTHTGLTPSLECFGECSTAWNRYLKNLEQNLNEGATNNQFVQRTRSK